VRSLRGRLSLGVGLIIAIVLGLSGVRISEYVAGTQRDAIDDRLKRTAELSRATAVDAVQNALPDTDRRLDAVLGATGSSLRLFVGSAVVLDAGRTPFRGAVMRPGLRTVTRGGRRYRVYVTTLRDAGLGDLARLEVISSLAESERRQERLDARLLRLGLGALLLAVLGTFLAATRVLQPLRRLRLAAGRIAEEEDLSVRVSETDGPGEVRNLAASFNAMLARLGTSARARERALDATRRFAADAGHELRTPLTTVQATLDALHRHPGVSAEQRTAMLGDALEEQRRLVTLLDGLQALARGDAGPPGHDDVDLGDVVATVVADVRTRHPALTLDADLPDAPVVIRGWAPGLRMLAGNLVENAAHHGRAAGTIRVTLTDGPAPVLTVDDDGGGIPEADRERVFAPFTRLEPAAGRPGTGLGLALVAQQARQHGAEVQVATSPSGGARFVVRFGRSAS
jgi:two-component system sensor histidine kinase PrrB